MQQEPADFLVYLWLASILAGLIIAALISTKGPWKLPPKHRIPTISGIGCLGSLLGFVMSAAIMAVIVPTGDAAEIGATRIGVAMISTAMLGSALLVGGAWRLQRSRERRQPAPQVTIRPGSHQPRTTPAAAQAPNPRSTSLHGGVFISYRREDTAHLAGRIHDRLRALLGSRLVFTDIDSIEPGIDFTIAIQRAVRASRIMLVMIGDHWLTIQEPTGSRRLDQPEDFVRMEIETGLRLGLRVIPVLADGAEMPKSVDLPPSLARLALLNAIEVRHASFGRDIDRLLEVVGRALQGPMAAK